MAQDEREAAAQPAATRRAGNVSHNLQGQRLGPKGRQTRERILAATVKMLTEEGPEQISLSAVARRVNLGLTSLYNYFSDLTELLLAVLEPVMAEGQEAYLQQLQKRWPDHEIEERARAFLDAYFDFWQRHTSILHLRNVMADRFDERMMHARVGAAMPILDGMRMQFAPGDTPLDPKVGAMASVLVAGIERSISLTTDTSIPAKLAVAFAPRRETLIESCTQLLYIAIRQGRGPV